MLIARDGKHAVVADPDRDRIVSVDLARREVVADIVLQAGDEPGRLVEDGAGRIHVALRRGGALFTLDSATATTGLRRSACASPRGLAWQASTDLVHVACAGGELVSFAATGDAVRTVRLERDLRDVIVNGDTLQVSRFRTAELLTLDAAGALVGRDTSPIVKREVTINPNNFPDDCPECIPAPQEMKIVDAVPAVAWRTIALADGSVVMSHQRQVKAPLSTEHDGYGQGCGGPVEHAVTIMRPGQPPFAVQRLVTGTLPVDVAVSPSGGMIAFAMAGTRFIHQVETTRLALPDLQEQDCGGGQDSVTPKSFDLGAPTSIAYLPDGRLAIFYPESPAIVVGDDIIQLTGGFGYDSGRALFHRRTNSGLACASCHPEGQDDGLVWEFDGIGMRRTQNIAGGILSRGPYHWNADLADLPTLMTEVFATRMAGGALSRSELLSIGPWIDRIPAPKGVLVDAAAAERGRVLFDSADVGCATCHSGSQLTNLQLFDVGTGGRFKVPSLVGVGGRAPYMHDGCATTLADRFGVCGGGDLHGKTSQLTGAQLTDLVSYLESL
jgi:hypothetical protein